jgi:hypothetical protein
VVLHWGQQRFTKTIPLDPQANNIATVWSVPLHHQYSAYFTEFTLSGITNYAYASKINSHDVVLEDQFEKNILQDLISFEHEQSGQGIDKITATDKLLMWHLKYGIHEEAPVYGIQRNTSQADSILSYRDLSIISVWQYGLQGMAF